MSSNPPNRQRLLLILAGSAIGLLVLDSLVIEPAIKIWRTHSQEIARLQTSVANGKNSIARAAQNDRVWKEMEANALPKDAAQAENEVYTALHRWADQNRVELPSERIGWKKGTNERNSLLEFRIDAAGNISSLSRFIYEIERSPMALRVDSI